MSKKRRLSFVAISLIVYIVLIVVMVLIERKAAGGTIKSLLDAIWYSIVTVSTVGYGDIYPVSLWGKIIHETVGIGIVTLSYVTGDSC